MIGAKPPVDEPERLSDLLGYGLLDTEHEEEYDSVARVITLVFDVPIAIVNLLDRDRQWFKASVGMDVSETPREVAFCAHTILDPAHPLVVKDALEDPRFEDNPLVLGPPRIRFYAGMPLVTPRGHAVGTIAAIDQVPHEVTDRQMDALRSLATLVVGQMELRRGMADLLKAARDRDIARRSVRDAYQQLSDVVEAIPDLIYVLDGDGRLVGWNDAVPKATGFSAEELMGRSPLAAVAEADRAAVSSAIRQAFTTGNAEVAASIIRKDGAAVPYHFTAGRLTDGHGNVVGVTGIGRDVGELMDAETRMRTQRDEQTRLAKRLQASNEDLEAFGHSVTHDLRAHLRAFRYTTQALREDCSESIGTRGIEYVDRLDREADNMLALLTGLMALSNATNKPLVRERIDVTSMAKEVASSLRVQNPARQVTFRIEDDMVVNGDGGLIRALLENLIGNAWKFTAETRDATIDVMLVEEGEGQKTLVVRDNGPGFDPAKAELIFRPFKRLMHGPRYPGTGIGLATVRRIADRHGGRVWAEAVPGGGATFFVTLGPAPAPEMVPLRKPARSAGPRQEAE